MDYRHHPDIHPKASAWSEEQTLYVACAYSNPFRWRTRRELANDFRRHMMQSPNVKLVVIELAYGDRPFDVTGPGCVSDPSRETDIQLRTRSELFHKECLLNRAVQSFPPGWQYGAIIDADVHFSRHDWALEAVHQLQHYDWVQLFSSYSDVSDRHRIVGTNNGFVYNYVENGYKVADEVMGGIASAGTYGGRRAGATGGAWAFRREAFDACGGLLDRCILGHGDWFAAFGLAGELAPDMRIANYSPAYREYIQTWQRRALEACRKNIGYIDCHMTHHWHGKKSNRGYSSRDAILVKHQYSPVRDVYQDWQGVLQLAPGAIGLRDDMRRYFLSRSEDTGHEE